MPQPPQLKKPAKKTIEFNRDVRPAISKCFTCHGHDPKAIMAGLKLDTRAGATAKLKDGKRAIVPYHPEQSEMIARIFAKNPDDLMPPPDSNKSLSADEKQILKTWIAEGAEYKEHWAFVKPVRPTPPEVKQKSWPRNTIDRFILAKLEDEGLRPAPEASKETLLRRVTLDLTGLPPTLDEQREFLADKSPGAYEKVVDRLLASPRYGERMAADWMDCARYADSNGYQADYERYQWRWRDWVIDAFNKDMPYDEFTIEQIAGDLLPHPTLDQKIATAFNRNHRINTEGGVIPEEWRVETVIDRVETTSETWLGLTAGCARCHDHKYDPISQKEFYSLYAYFNNVPESGTGVEQPVNHPPLIKAPYPDQSARMAYLNSRINYLNAEMDGRLKGHDAEIAAWTPKMAAPPASLSTGVAERYTLSDPPKVEGSGPTPKVVDKVTFDSGRSTGAVATSDKGYVDLGAVGDFDTHHPFSYCAWVEPDMGSGSPIAKMDPGHDYRGWDLMLQDYRPAAHFIDTWPSNALKVVSKAMLPQGKWSHVVVTYDGSATPAGVHIYVDGKKTEADVEQSSLRGSIRTPVTAKIGRRTGESIFSGKVDDLRLFDRVVTPDEAAALANVHPAAPILATPPEKRSTAQKAQLARYWAMDNDPTYRDLNGQVEQTAADRSALDSRISTLMVMEEMPKPRDCHVLIRGQYDHPGDKVTAGLPAALPPLPKGAPNNRLGLAEWIVDPSNPLTPRVLVNRLWEHLFGTGIVETSEDFGTRSDFPSHPELLDWLATEALRQKWSLKAMIKEMVMSATYRQSSDITAEDLKKDPKNRLLERGPRFRLPAEMIRDQALAASGMLTEQIGGPSVRPYQPAGVWDDVSVYGNLHHYKHDIGPNLHRRSLYTIWKRTAAPPIMTLFDVPARETCRVRRARTNTPLQALALLDDVTYVEAARALANRMMQEGGPTAKSRIDFAFRALLSRSPSQKESNLLLASLAKRIKHYDASPAAAAKLLSEGDWPNDPRLSQGELAAYTVIASTILNLDETITKE